jgi:hypothetical protein
MFGAIGPSDAADMPTVPQPRVVVHACGPGETVVLFDERGRPTVPARTPYFYCVTGTTLLPGDILLLLTPGRGVRAVRTRGRRVAAADDVGQGRSSSQRRKRGRRAPRSQH